MKSTVGIEISGQYLKLIIVKAQSAGQPKLSDCIVEAVASLNDEQVAQKVSEILRRLNFKPRLATLSISRSFATVRNLHLPSQEKGEIAQMIDLHIGRVVTYKKEDIILGYQILGADDLGYTKIILAILDSNTLRRRLKILEKAGLFIDKISLSSYGTWQWVLNCQRQDINRSDIYLILDIDSLFTDFIICSHDNLLFTRGITVGANEAGLTTETGVPKLLSEIKQSLTIFNNEEINKKPSGVFLAGASPADVLKKAIEAELAVPVKTVISPLQKISGEAKDIPRDISLTGVAELTLGDSPRRINFILPEIQIKKALKEKAKELMILGSLCIYILTVSTAIFLGKIYHQQNYLRSLNIQSQAIEKEMGDLITQLGRIEFVKGYLDNRSLQLFAFSKLQRVIPEQIAVISLNIDEQGRIILRGQGVHISEVFKFVSTLEKSKYFTDIQTKYTRTKKIKEREIAEFELNLQIRPDEKLPAS